MRHATPALFTASAHVRARSRSRSTGFSQKICLPDEAAAWIRSAWVSVDEQISTAPTPPSSNTSATLATCAPCRSANVWANFAFGSTTYLRRAPASFARLPAWMLPMRPAPKSATSIMRGSLAGATIAPGRKSFYVTGTPSGRIVAAASRSMKNNTAFAAGRRFDIICLGRFAVDFYAQQIGARLEDVASFAKYLGGSSANTAFGCARLGLKAAMAARVGDDAMGRFLVETIAREGCDVSHVSVDPARLTAAV